MPIYKQTTEITNIDDLLSSVERDIEEVYFGDKQVFIVWDTYDGTLPATYSANGSMLADYRVYGSAGGVGDKTENLFDPNAADVKKGCFYDAQGVRVTNVYHNESGFIPVSPGEYTFSFIRKAGGSTFYVNFYDANKTFVSNIGSLSGNLLNKTVTVQDDGYVRLNFSDYYLAFVVFKRGGVASYVPYGYVIPMSVSDGTTSATTPIYIGGTALGEDEYADYKAGKIYRTTKNIMPSAAAGSATDHGVTVTCDGNSTYQISGRANGNAVIRFDLREFTIPAALDNGGNGVISVSYPRDPNVTIYLLDGNNAVYTINPYYGNVYTDYGIGLTIDGIAFAIADGQYADEFPFIIMITNDGTVPSVIDDYVPHLTPVVPPVSLPALPTVDGVTITDYAGQSVAPTEFYAKYRKQNS